MAQLGSVGSILRMRMRYLAIPLVLLCTACASPEYIAYANAQALIAKSKADSDTARYSTLSNIAATGTDSARIAAVMALAMGGGSNSAPATQIQAPQASQALQWASVLIPGLTTLASINANMRVGLANADSSARIAESTNATFLGVASKIQAPVVAAPTVVTPVLPQANVTTTTTTTDNHAVSTVSTANPTTTTTSTTTNANPTTTTTSLAGTGVLGNGSYTANPSTTTLSGTGVLGTGTFTTTDTHAVTTTNPLNNPVVVTPVAKVCTVDNITKLVNCI